MVCCTTIGENEAWVHSKGEFCRVVATDQTRTQGWAGALLQQAMCGRLPSKGRATFAFDPAGGLFYRVITPGGVSSTPGVILHSGTGSRRDAVSSKQRVILGR